MHYLMDNPQTVIKGWYYKTGNRVSSEWKSLQSVLNKRSGKLQQVKKKKYALHVLRGYFLGPSQRRAPPYAIILCNDRKTSESLLKTIHDTNRNKHWAVAQLWSLPDYCVWIGL